jgi:hypothetical protein
MQRIVDTEIAAETGPPGITIAVVIHPDVTREGRQIGYMDLQIGGADRSPRTERAIGAQAGHIAQQQQAAIQRTQGDQVAAMQRRQSGRQRVVVHPAVVAQGDRAITCFKYRDPHGGIMRLLRGDISARHQVAVLAVVVGDAGGQGIELRQAQLPPFLVGDQSMQCRRIKAGIADYLDFLYLERHRIVGRMGGRRFDFECRPGRFDERHGGRDFLHQLAAAWRHLGVGRECQGQAQSQRQGMTGEVPRRCFGGMHNHCLTQMMGKDGPLRSPATVAGCRGTSEGARYG